MKIIDIVESSDKNESVFDEIISSAFFIHNYEVDIFELPTDKNIQWEIPWLYHASDHLESQSGIIDVKLRDKPRDTSTYVHNLVNEESMKRYGVPVRNLVFATSKLYNTDEYGYGKYILFPLDTDYTLFYSSNIEDFTETYENSKHGSKRLYSVINYVSQHLPEFREIPQSTWKSYNCVLEFNDVTSDTDVRQFIERVVEDNVIKDDISSIVIEGFVKYHREYTKNQVDDYLNTIVQEKAVVDQSEEYMIYSSRVAYVKLDNINDLINRASKLLTIDK